VKPGSQKRQQKNSKMLLLIAILSIVISVNGKKIGAYNAILVIKTSKIEWNMKSQAVMSMKFEAIN
jgi:hypothetical protein